MATSTAQKIAANEKRFNEMQIHDWALNAGRDTAKRLCRADNKAWFVQEEAREAKKGNVVPWYAIALVKERESGADPSFLRNIAQGDAWNAKSTHVPKGRGPFKSWYEAADDALEFCAPYMAHWKDWSAGGLMTIEIRYNGDGYDNHGMVSPYGYSGTDQYVKGKYTSDGHLDVNAVDKQLGVGVVLKCMMEIDPTIQLATPGTPYRAGPPPKEIVDDKTKNSNRLRKAGAATAGAGGAGEVGNVATTPDQKPTTKTGTQQPVPAPSVSGPSDLMWFGVIAIGVVIVGVATFNIVRQKKQLLAEWF